MASAALRPSTLELELRNKSLLLTERQERLLNDLRILRNILEKVGSVKFIKSIYTILGGKFGPSQCACFYF